MSNQGKRRTGVKKTIRANKVKKKAMELVKLAKEGVEIMNAWALVDTIEGKDRDALSALSASVYATSVSKTNTPQGQRQAYIAALYAAYNMGKHGGLLPEKKENESTI